MSDTTPPTDHETALTNAALGFAEAISDADKEARAVQESQVGGTDWELSEAIRAMGEAHAAGDPAQIATAMRRHAEALTNAANTTLIPTLKHVLETVVRSEVGKIYERMDSHNRADLDRRTEDRTRMDAQSDYLYKELDELKGLAQGGRADLGKLSAQVGDMGLTLAAVGGDVSDLKEGQADHAQRLDAHDTQIAALQEVQGKHSERIDAHDKLLKLLSESRARLDEWQKWLGGA